MSYQLIEVRQEGVTLDSLCWTHYKTTIGTTELVYNVNPGLSQWQVFLPVGLKIKMPDLDIAPVKGTIKLWEDSP